MSTGTIATWRSRPPLALGVTGALVAAAMVLPVGHLVLRASEANDVIGLVASERTLGLVSSTLRLALASTVLAVVLGAGTAWLVERTDLPARRALGLTAVLPLVVPSYVAALALVAAFGPAGLAFEVPGLLGFWGAVVALGLSSYPYVLLLTRAALARADPALEEAARALGDGNPAVFGRVLLPQLRPAITAGGLLVFLYVLSDFGAVAILRYDTLTRAIFTEVRSNFSNRGAPAVLGVVLVIFTLVAIGVERRLRGRPAPSRAVAGVCPARTVALGRWRWPAMIWVTAVVTVGLGVPLGVIGYWATVGASNADPGLVLARAATTSMGLSMAAAIVAAGVAVPVAVLAVRHRSSFSRVVETLAVSGYALPGLVVALALVFFAIRYVPGLYGTLALIVVAYVVRFLPEALGPVRSSLLQVDPALEEAAQSLGRTRLAAAATVTLPLVSKGLVAGAVLVFLTAMKELPATLLLSPAGYDTLATRVWTGADNGLYAQAAPAALLVVAVSALVLWPMHLTWQTRATGRGEITAELVGASG